MFRRASLCFVWMDRYLDTASSGPVYLRQEVIARLVVDSLFRGVDLGHYELGAFVLMANHVHVLLRPLVVPSRLLQSLKGATARAANRVLGRTGESFWQRESYDHWVRDEREWELNPHGPFGPLDFKSNASASFAIPPLQIYSTPPLTDNRRDRWLPHLIHRPPPS